MVRILVEATGVEVEALTRREPRAKIPKSSDLVLKHRKGEYWWRRRELNPRPQALSVKRLHV